MGVDSYIGTTACALDHYFGNNLIHAKMKLVHREAREGINIDLDELKREFISGLEGALSDTIPEYGGITKQHIRETIELARGDWSNVEIIKSIYRKIFAIKCKPFDEQALFGTNHESS